MKNIYIIIGLIPLLIGLIIYRPDGFNPYYVSFYSIIVTFTAYSMFTSLNKLFPLRKLLSFPFHWLTFVILFIGTLILITDNNLTYNIVSLLLATTIIFLVYLVVHLLGKKKTISVNNIPAFFNVIIILPAVFRDQFHVADTIFKFNILNTTINDDNKRFTLLCSLLLILILITLIIKLKNSKLNIDEKRINH